jgi:hypothetical protein
MSLGPLELLLGQRRAMPCMTSLPVTEGASKTRESYYRLGGLNHCAAQRATELTDATMRS